MKERPLPQLAREVRPFIERAGYTQIPGDEAWLEKMIATLRERAKTMVELVDFAKFYLSDDDHDRSQGRGEISQAGDRRAA